MSKFQSIANKRVLTLHIINGLGWSALITAMWTILCAFEIYRETLLTTYHVHSNLQSHVHAEAREGLNAHLESISASLRRDGIGESPNSILIIDQSGEITGSSVKAWQNLNILDVQFGTGLFDNMQLSTLRRCIATGINCDSDKLEGQHFSNSSLVFGRELKFHQHHHDLGMKTSKNYLIFVFNYSDAYADLIGSAIIGFICITLLVTLISAVPLLYTTRNLLPFVYTSLQKDSLTGLSNRAMFTEQAIIKLEDAEINQTSYVLAILDVDNFKHINDTLGHKAGDLVLAEYGLIIDQAIRKDTDLSSRFGGEEFCLLLKCTRSSAATILERLRLQIEIHDVKLEHKSVSTTASIGAASSSECGYNIDYLVMKADDALYRAKNEGKNQIKWHDNSLI